MLLSNHSMASTNTGHSGLGHIANTATTATNPLSKYLQPVSQPAITNPKTTTATTVRGGARVLTSAECLKLIKEKAAKKKREEEEKAMRKQERELKKKQREELKKQKAAAKEQKAKERAEKARIAADKRVKKASTTRRRAQTKPSNSARNEENISSDICCACFGSYQQDVAEQNGAEWIQCSCTHWLHEDCIVAHLVNSEQLCSHCV